MANPAAIGVFDSGLGGLSVLRELQALLPQEQFIYVADSAHCPYGGKSAEAITARARAITEFLLEQGVKLVVVACNTATIAAIETLRAEFPISFVGMEPAVKPAVAATSTGVVGVLATGAALQGEKLHRLIAAHAGSVRVLTQPCPGLVEQVEQGELQGAATEALLQRYTAPLIAAGADVLVLGCTHYPFLRPALQALLGPKVQLLDTGAAVARRALSLLQAERTAVDAVTGGRGSVRYFSSAEPLAMADAASRLLGVQIHVEALP